jgi:lysozyme family protein
MKYGTKWPEYSNQWDSMNIKTDRESEFKKYANFAIKQKDRYIKIEQKTGVPWTLISVLHRRESNSDFDTYLGNGQPLNKKTTIIPIGRGPFASFEDGAVDALKLDGLSSVIDWRLEKILYYCELFNGTGYNNHGRPSPYIWGGTNIQVIGKYVRDGVWDPTVWDGQPGCAPILATIAKLDSTVAFIRET